MLPNAVKKQLQVAEDRYKQVYGNTENTDETPNEAVGVVDEAPGKEEQEQQAQPTKNWEAAYKVLQGKFNAEVPRLHEQIRTLEAEIKELKTRPAAPPPSPIKDEEVQEYGENFVDFVKRAASTVVPEGVSKVPEIEKSIEEIRAETLRQSKRAFLSDLTRLAPNWESLNEDPDFIAWLDESDQFSGRKRQQLLDDACSSFDAERAARFFTTYGRGKEPEQPKDLTEHVVPPTSKVDVPVQGKRIWTPGEIKSFFDTVSRGGYRGREAEAAQIERDIYAAQREGRIRRPRM
ncbi:MAG: hypothetical protein WDA07_06485 [Leucobacter sp.]